MKKIFLMTSVSLSLGGLFGLAVDNNNNNDGISKTDWKVLLHCMRSDELETNDDKNCERLFRGLFAGLELEDKKGKQICEIIKEKSEKTCEQDTPEECEYAKEFASVVCQKIKEFDEKLEETIKRMKTRMEEFLEEATKLDGKVDKIFLVAQGTPQHVAK